MKDRLEIVRQARLGKTAKGFALPWHKDCVKHRINRSGRMDDLIPRRELDLFLPRMGIPTQFAVGPANAILGDDIFCYRRLRFGNFSKGACSWMVWPWNTWSNAAWGGGWGAVQPDTLRHGTGGKRVEKRRIWRPLCR